MRKKAKDYEGVSYFWSWFNTIPNEVDGDGGSGIREGECTWLER
jgi:hypothetical protein